MSISVTVFKYFFCHIKIFLILIYKLKLTFRHCATYPWLYPGGLKGSKLRLAASCVLFVISTFGLWSVSTARVEACSSSVLNVELQTLL